MTKCPEELCQIPQILILNQATLQSFGLLYQESLSTGTTAARTTQMTFSMWIIHVSFSECFEWVEEEDRFWVREMGGKVKDKQQRIDCSSVGY